MKTALKVWRVTAWTSIPHRKHSHQFASCEVVASSRSEARRRALNRVDIISDLQSWTAGAGHALTVSVVRPFNGPIDAEKMIATR